MITLSIITQTHNRRNMFLKNFEYNFKKINNYIQNLNIKIDWIINVDDKSVLKKDINKYEKLSPKINIIFLEKTNFFSRRYFELMVYKKNDFIWCLEDDDRIYSNFFKFLVNKNYNYVFYFKTDYKKIEKDIDFYLLNKTINFETWQMSQIVMKYKDILKYFLFKKQDKKYFLTRDYIEYDEDIIYYFKKKFNIKIIPEKIFIQNIHGENMSYNDLIKWKN